MQQLRAKIKQEEDYLQKAKKQLFEQRNMILDDVNVEELGQEEPTFYKSALDKLERRTGSLNDIEGELDKLLGTLRSQRTSRTTIEERPKSNLQPRIPPQLNNPSQKFQQSYSESKTKSWDVDRIRSEAVLSDHQQWLRKFSARNAVLQRHS